MRYGDISSFQSGVAVPLFSLRSRASIGIGEFLDLIPFAKWCKMCDFDIIQLLPVNDTGAEASPYSARSAFALNPVFINIQAVQGSGEFEGKTCDVCAGNGKCKECGGVGKRPCKNCGATGIVDCNECHGSGKEECQGCHGTLKCEACGGSGFNPHK